MSRFGAMFALAGGDELELSLGLVHDPHVSWIHNLNIIEVQGKFLAAKIKIAGGERR